jgi:hypothetical protein
MERDSGLEPVCCGTINYSIFNYYKLLDFSKMIRNFRLMSS